MAVSGTLGLGVVVVPLAAAWWALGKWPDLGLLVLAVAVCMAAVTSIVGLLGCLCQR